jgi:Putative MetA-pathway of phenol degradation
LRFFVPVVMNRDYLNSSAPLALAAFCAGAAGASAEVAPPVSEPRPDKSVYNLFHPTPREYLRELSTDRPDKTESPRTVDAGHFQIEMDLATYFHDRDRSGGGDTRSDALAIAPINLKVGLLNNVDLQLILETYNFVRVEDRVAGTVENKSGFGDTTVRVKVNAWGNDQGSSALAVMPFVKLPTNQDDLAGDSVEGGIIIPFGFELPRGWELGFTTVYGFGREDTSSDYDAVFINSATLGHDLFGDLGGYVEFFSEVNTGQASRWVGTVDFGLTYEVTANLRLDAGVNVGITESADDVNPFVGMSWRY